MVTPLIKKRGFAHLDGLRGLASLAVVFMHLFLWFYPAMMDGTKASAHSDLELLFYQLPVNIFWNGNFAVCIFFVLSGFVLSYKFFATGQDEAVRSGAFRRFPRLVIPVFVSVVIGYFCLRFGFFWNNELVELNKTPGVVQAFWSQTGGALSAVYQGTVGVFTREYDFSQHFNPVLWTMYFEFVGSFIVFGFLAVFGKAQSRWLVYGALLALLIDSFLLGFVLGMIVADVHTSRKRLFESRGAGAAALALGIILGTIPNATADINTYFILGLPLDTELNQLLHIAGAVLLIYSVLSLTALQKLLQLRPIVFLGRISFGLYLIHTFLIAVVAKRLFEYFHIRLMFPYSTSFLLTAELTVMLAILAAWIYTILFDESAVRFSRVLYERWGEGRLKPRLAVGRPAPLRTIQSRLRSLLR